jgi:DNA replication and repair protein RecF
MRISNLKTFHFRNLASSEIKVNAQDVFLVGENGQGKSNFLEALYFCSYASSFRTTSEKELIQDGQTECSVFANIDNSVNNTVQISLVQDKKNIILDGKNIKDRKALLSAAPSIVFCHEDMQFITGSPEERRWFFDQNLCLYDIVYLDFLRKYKKILKTRNTVLKELKERIHTDYSLLEVIDPQFINSGLEILKRRTEETKQFAEILTPLYKEISGIEDVSIEYQPSWKYDNEPAILLSIIEKREREIMIGTSLSGPHRDRYFFTRKGKDFSKNASTGQRRLLALLIRLAQYKRYFSAQKNKPILLLDDVLLELDGKKRLCFFSILPEYDQAFYTFLPEEPFNKYKKNDTLIYEIKGGCFTALN